MTSVEARSEDSRSEELEKICLQGEGEESAPMESSGLGKTQETERAGSEKGTKGRPESREKRRVDSTERGRERERERRPDSRGRDRRDSRDRRGRSPERGGRSRDQDRRRRRSSSISSVDSEKVTRMCQERQQLRRLKDYRAADKIMDDLARMGVRLRDRTFVWSSRCGKEGTYSGKPSRRRDGSVDSREVDELCQERQMCKNVRDYAHADIVRYGFLCYPFFQMKGRVLYHLIQLRQELTCQ